MSVVSQIMRLLPGVLACGVLSLQTGEWIAVDSVRPHSKEFLDFLAQQTKALFVGDGVKTIKEILEKEDPTGRRPGEFSEVTMLSTHCLHVFLRPDWDPGRVVSVVTDRSTKMGLVLGTLRELLKEPDRNEQELGEAGTGQASTVDELFD